MDNIDMTEGIRSANRDIIIAKTSMIPAAARLYHSINLGP